MKIRTPFIYSSASWSPLTLDSGKFRHWLRDRGSLTQRLQLRCDEFTVERVHQSWARPMHDEARLLGMHDGERALLREVTLCCKGMPMVFAHSVLPQTSLQGEWRALGRLASRPLGAALFANPGVMRTPLTYRKLLPGDLLYHRACMKTGIRPDRLWARRSIFILGHRPILVTEVFLPDILLLPAA